MDERNDTRAICCCILLAHAAPLFVCSFGGSWVAQEESSNKSGSKRKKKKVFVAALSIWKIRKKRESVVLLREKERSRSFPRLHTTVKACRSRGREEQPLEEEGKKNAASGLLARGNFLRALSFLFSFPLSAVLVVTP